MGLTATAQIQDLALLRIFVMQMEGGIGSPRRQLRQLTVPGRMGAATVESHSAGPREVAVTGSIFAHSLSMVDREIAEDDLKDMMVGQVAVIRIDDGVNAAREISGLCTAVDIRRNGPTLLAMGSEFSISLNCDDPLWRDVYPITIGVGETPVEVPLGTAPSPVIARIMGAAGAVVDPSVIVRGITGAVAAQLDFDISLSDDDYIEHDCLNGITRKSIDGTVSEDATIFVGGSPFLALDPKTGSRLLNSGPTVELTAASGTPTGEIEYTRRYL